MKIHGNALNKTSTRKTATPSILFNGGYKFGEELLSEENPIALEIESLKSFEAFCIFGHREFFHTLVRVATRFESLLLGKDPVVPQRMLKMMNLLDRKLIYHVTQLNTYEDSRHPQSYTGLINKLQMIVHCSVTRPVQFLLGDIGSAAAFTDKHGTGWNNQNIKRYFDLPNKNDSAKKDKSTEEDENDGKTKENSKRNAQLMNTARQYEAHHVILWTMRQIKITKMKDSDRMEFHIMCEMKNYQPTNKTLRARHSSLFKKPTYSFQPIDDLVLSMPYNFIATLQQDIWTNIDKDWIRSLHQHLNKSDNNVIKQIRFVWKIYFSIGTVPRMNMNLTVIG